MKYNGQNHIQKLLRTFCRLWRGIFITTTIYEVSFHINIFQHVCYVNIAKKTCTLIRFYFYATHGSWEFSTSIISKHVKWTTLSSWAIFMSLKSVRAFFNGKSVSRLWNFEELRFVLLLQEYFYLLFTYVLQIK